MNSGNTYRLRPDGSHIEQCTWGQVNPFGLSFDRRGDLYSCDCHSRPIYQLLRRGVLPELRQAARRARLRPRDDAARPRLDRHRRHRLLRRRRSSPGEFRDTIFIGNVVTSRINHDRIEWHGSQPRGDRAARLPRQRRPLVPPGRHRTRSRRGAVRRRLLQPHHRPLRGAVDPSRPRPRAGPDLADRLYRAGAARRRRSPRGRTGPERTVDELIDDLGHPNLAVQTLAANEIARRGGDDAKRTAREAKADAVQPLADRPGPLAHATPGRSERGRPDRGRRTTDRSRSHPRDAHPRRTGCVAAPLWDLAVAGLKDDRSIRPTGRGARTRPSSVPREPATATRHADTSPTRSTATWSTSSGWPCETSSGPATRGRTSATPAFSEADLHAVADVALGVQDAASARFLLAYLRRFEGSTRRFATGRVPHRPLWRGALDGELDGTRPGPPSRRPPVPGRAGQGNAPGDRGTRRRHAEGLARTGRRSGAVAPGGQGDEAITAGLDLAGSFRLDALFEPVAALADSDDTPQPAAQRRVERPAGDRRRARSRSARHRSDRRRGADRPSHPRGEPAGQGGPPEARRGLLDALPTAPARLQTTIAAGLDREPATGPRRCSSTIAAGKASPRLLRERAVEVKLAVGRSARTGRASRRADPGCPPVDEAVRAATAGRREGFAGARPDADPRARPCSVELRGLPQDSTGRGREIGPQLDGVGVRGPIG